MNIKKTKAKLKKQTDKDLKILQELLHEELDSRMKYFSNTENTPNEISTSLSEAFSQAWIHG